MCKWNIHSSNILLNGMYGISFRTIGNNTLPIVLNEIPFKHVLTYTFLGVYIDEKLDWKQQYGYVMLCRVIGIIIKLNNNLNLNTRIYIFKSLFIFHLNYCSHI